MAHLDDLPLEVFYIILQYEWRLLPFLYLVNRKMHSMLSSNQLWLNYQRHDYALQQLPERDINSIDDHHMEFAKSLDSYSLAASLLDELCRPQNPVHLVDKITQTITCEGPKLRPALLECLIRPNQDLRRRYFAELILQLITVKNASFKIQEACRDDLSLVEYPELLLSVDSVITADILETPSGTLDFETKYPRLSQLDINYITSNATIKTVEIMNTVIWTEEPSGPQMRKELGHNILEALRRPNEYKNDVEIAMITYNLLKWIGSEQKQGPRTDPARTLSSLYDDLSNSHHRNPIHSRIEDFMESIESGSNDMIVNNIIYHYYYGNFKDLRVFQRAGAFEYVQRTITRPWKMFEACMRCVFDGENQLECAIKGDPGTWKQRCYIVSRSKDIGFLLHRSENINLVYDLKKDHLVLWSSESTYIIRAKGSSKYIPESSQAGQFVFQDSPPVEDVYYVDPHYSYESVMELVRKHGNADPMPRSSMHPTSKLYKFVKDNQRKI